MIRQQSVKQNRKSVYDQKVNSVKYNPSDLLLVKSETGTKLQVLYDGPYLVLEDIGPNVVILKNNKREIIHKNRTKPFVTNIK